MLVVAVCLLVHTRMWAAWLPAWIAMDHVTFHKTFATFLLNYPFCALFLSSRYQSTVSSLNEGGKKASSAISTAGTKIKYVISSHLLTFLFFCSLIYHVFFTITSFCISFYILYHSGKMRQSRWLEERLVLLFNEQARQLRTQEMPLEPTRPCSAGVIESGVPL